MCESGWFWWPGGGGYFSRVGQWRVCLQARDFGVQEAGY